jgi:hypothetical protein
VDARKRLGLARKSEAKIKKKIEAAEKSIKKLDETAVPNQSLLIKYRGNITVPAVWLPQQGVRLNDLPFIPAEKISNLNTYITDRTKNIDGGNLDVP